MNRDDLPNLSLLEGDSEYTALLDNIAHEYGIEELPNFKKDTLLKLLSTFYELGEREKVAVQECMRRFQLRSDTLVFGAKQVFFHLCARRALEGLLEDLFGVLKGGVLLGQFIALGKMSRDDKAAKTAELNVILENNVHNIDKNLRLADMPLRKHLCWLFTTGYGQLGSLEKIIAHVQNNELPNALGLPRWPDDKEYFLFRLNMPENHLLYRPTVMDGDFPNQYYQSGGKTKPRNSEVCELGEQAEWVVKGRPSFSMIDEVIYVEIN